MKVNETVYKVTLKLTLFDGKTESMDWLVKKEHKDAVLLLLNEWLKRYMLLERKQYIIIPGVKRCQSSEELDINYFDKDKPGAAIQRSIVDEIGVKIKKINRKDPVLQEFLKKTSSKLFSGS